MKIVFTPDEFYSGIMAGIRNITSDSGLNAYYRNWAEEIGGHERKVEIIEAFAGRKAELQREQAAQDEREQKRRRFEPKGKAK